VVAKAVAAKVDRPAGVVVFNRRERPEEVLSAWSGNVSKLLASVEKACQQIAKEATVHKVTLGKAA
jgi:26S proteasome regulatory subunit N5